MEVGRFDTESHKLWKEAWPSHDAIDFMSRKEASSRFPQPSSAFRSYESQSPFPRDAHTPLRGTNAGIAPNPPLPPSSSISPVSRVGGPSNRPPLLPAEDGGSDLGPAIITCVPRLGGGGNPVSTLPIPILPWRGEGASDCVSGGRGAWEEVRVAGLRGTGGAGLREVEVEVEAEEEGEGEEDVRVRMKGVGVADVDVGVGIPSALDMDLNRGG